MVTHLVVDGSNIATEGRKTPSLKQLEEAVQEFLAERPHDHVIVIVDATFPNRIDKAELARYEHLIDAGWMLTPPAGAIGRGDAFILQVAIKADATVLSNDSFQEFHGDHDWLFQDNRLVGGKPIPGVGWVFVDRAPVRGATSRRAVRDAKRKEAADSPEGDDTSAKSEAVADKAGGRGAKRARGKKDSTDSTDSTDKSAKPAVGDRKASDAAPAGAADDSPKGDKGTDKPILNNAAEFVSFVASNLPGSKVSAVVESFSSHGAYVTVGSTTCYAPLRLMGDPAPRSARSVLTLGETVEFTVHATDPAHNAIDLALVPNDETPPPPKKSAAKKSPAKKSPAKKATAKKTTAKKSAARKSPAKKSAAKKATAKKSAAKESTATSEATTTPSGSRTRTRTIKPAESEPDPNS